MFNEIFWNIVGFLSLTTTFLSGAISNILKIKKGKYKQIISWFVAIILSCVVVFCKMVSLPEPLWMEAISLSIITALSSNGVYDIPTIKNTINKMFGNTTNNEGQESEDK